MVKYPKIEIIDISDSGDQARAREISAQIGRACREHGFFYITGHGVDEALQVRLEHLSRQFFALQLEEKMRISMDKGGPAWRGFFPVGDELTSGKPDQKEGIYFGQELSSKHPKVQAAVPLHGQNLFPAIPEFREVILDYLSAMTKLGHLVLELMALSLNLERTYFRKLYTDDPLILFRIFHYPPLVGLDKSGIDRESYWSVGEHTDYGILTILKQDEVSGLEVKSGSNWIAAPPIEGSFVCNIGDMLDRMTGGLYRSTPHRVRNTSNTGRLSFPFFFDPNFDTVVKPIDMGITVDDDKDDRWDGASVHEFSGTYGEYILEKVSRVFPQLSEKNINQA